MMLSPADLLALKSGLADLKDPRLTPAQRLMGRCAAADRTPFNALSVESLMEWHQYLTEDLAACPASKMAPWAAKHLKQIALQLDGKLARGAK